MMDTMYHEKANTIQNFTLDLISEHLARKVKIDIYYSHIKSSTIVPVKDDDAPALLLINDGQNMPELGLTGLLNNLFDEGFWKPLVCVAIHAGEHRKMEYGTAGVPNYLGQGNKATAYTQFVLYELVPQVMQALGVSQFSEKWFAGFSLGGLSALDIAWAHPHEFTKVGVFSGSLWWRIIDQDDPAYDDEKHRIMHQLVRKGNYAAGLKFFFVTGTLDETSDRNNNGIIDSIDDTLGLITELNKKGYQTGKDIVYLELPDGRHDIATWAKAMPAFLRWTMGS